MRDSKKAIVSTAVVLLSILILSFVLLYPSTSYTRSDDSRLRDELAGRLDFLVIGASQAQCSLDTRELDRALFCNSYNLSADAMCYYEKNYLLNKELGRNQVKTVVLDLCYDTLYHGEVSSYSDANCYFTQRQDTFPDRMRYIGRIGFDNKLFVYSQWMANSLLNTAKHIFSVNDPISKSARELKGSKKHESTDYRLSNEEITNTYCHQSIDFSKYNNNYINAYIDWIQLCRAQNIRVIIAVVPVSDSYIWSFDNLDAFNEWAKSFCSEQNVEYYDFNLLKDRYSLLSDENCYSTDSHHMSGIGSERFTREFAEIIKEANEGIDVSDRFYPSYAELIHDSPYMEIYLRTNQD